MLYICATRFKVEQRETNFTKELISVREVAILDQERGLILPLPSLDLISNSEEAKGSRSLLTSLFSMLVSMKQKSEKHGHRSGTRSE
jgi:hypothetical protein